MNLPPEYDLRAVTYFSKFLGRHRLFDFAVESGIAHHVLGGLWYAAALFYSWVKAAANSDAKVRARVLTIFAGLGIAVVLAFIAAKLLAWSPPSQVLRASFPEYLPGNINSSSFPSFSTTIYTVVALGIFSLDRIVGESLLVGIPVAIALPRSVCRWALPHGCPMWFCHRGCGICGCTLGAGEADNSTDRISV